MWNVVWWRCNTTVQLRRLWLWRWNRNVVDFLLHHSIHISILISSHVLGCHDRFTWLPKHWSVFVIDMSISGQEFSCWSWSNLTASLVSRISIQELLRTKLSFVRASYFLKQQRVTKSWNSGHSWSSRSSSKLLVRLVSYHIAFVRKTVQPGFTLGVYTNRTYWELFYKSMEWNNKLTICTCQSF